jgi:exopolysaccharide production protein ExoZ
MKLLSIQYLRALAAVLVVLAHAADHPLAQTPSLLTQLGEFGVTLFFVISGFIMVTISGPDTFNPLKFLKRRIVRVVPLYWCFTALAAVLALTLPSLFKSTVFTLPHFLQSLMFIPHEAPGRGGFSPLLSLGWTLNYEMFFYLTFAALAFLGATHRVLLLGIIFAGLALYGQLANPSNVVLSFYANLSLVAFSAGTGLGLLHLQGRTVRIWASSRAGLIIVALLLPMLGLAGTGELAYFALVAGSSALVLSATALEARLPHWPLLERLGDASYSLYLSHIFVVGAMVVVGGKILSTSDILGYAVVVATATGSAIAAGFLIHYALEKPLLQLFGQPRSASRSRLTPAVASA